MPYYDIDELLNDEFGDTKKKAKAKPKRVKLLKKPPARSFIDNMRQQRQSTNVVDLRGTRPVLVEGGLT
jgi:hypothetical protein